MATTPSAARKTCALRAEAPVFVTRKAGEFTGFKLNPAAAEYKPSKGQQVLDQLFGMLIGTSVSDEAMESSGNETSSNEASGSAASSSDSTLVDTSTGTVSDGPHRQGSPCHGTLHHYYIHHHPSRHLRQVHSSATTHHALPGIDHAEFVDSVEHLEHASRTGHNHPGHLTHVPSSGYMHIQPPGATQHLPYNLYPPPERSQAILAGTPVPNYTPIPCEAYLVDHPLRDPRTGYWEVPKAQPIRHRYSVEDLSLFRSTHTEYKTQHDIPLYAATNRSQSHQGTNGDAVNSQGQTMAREYHAQNTYEYRDLESTQKVYGRAEGFWYGWH